MAATTSAYFNADLQAGGWLPYVFGSEYWHDVDKVWHANCPGYLATLHLMCGVSPLPSLIQQKYGCLTHRHAPLIHSYRLKRYYFHIAFLLQVSGTHFVALWPFSVALADVWCG